MLTILSPLTVALLGVRVMVLRMTADSPMDIDMGERVFLLLMLVGLPLCCYLASGIALLVGSRARKSPLARLTVTVLVSIATTTAAVLVAT